MSERRSGPLRGIRVLDFSIALTGPYAAALMADQGADVVKVERPGIGDLGRWVGVAVNGMSALYFTCNRGKRSIALDLHHPEGVEIALRLAAESDVIVENYRPGVMEKLGLGYEAVRALNPEIVYASLTGFGSEGPYRDRSAYDTVIQAYGGFAINQADPTNGGVPVFLRQTAADKVTALYASQAITAALFARANGDGGQHLELSMMDSVVSFLWADAAGNEVLTESDGSLNSSFVAGFQPMRFEDGWGIVTPTSDADFQGMCKALDVEGWDDPRVATMTQRRENRDVMEPIMDMVYAERGQPHAGPGDEAVRGTAGALRDDPQSGPAHARRARGCHRAVRGGRPPHRGQDADAAPSHTLPRHPGRAHQPLTGPRRAHRRDPQRARPRRRHRPPQRIRRRRLANQQGCVT